MQSVFLLFRIDTKFKELFFKRQGSLSAKFLIYKKGCQTIKKGEQELGKKEKEKTIGYFFRVGCSCFKIEFRKRSLIENLKK